MYKKPPCEWAANFAITGKPENRTIAYCAMCPAGSIEEKPQGRCHVRDSWAAWFYEARLKAEPPLTECEERMLWNG